MYHTVLIPDHRLNIRPYLLSGHHSLRMGEWMVGGQWDVAVGWEVGKLTTKHLSKAVVSRTSMVGPDKANKLREFSLAVRITAFLHWSILYHLWFPRISKSD